MCPLGGWRLDIFYLFYYRVHSEKKGTDNNCEADLCFLLSRMQSVGFLMTGLISDKLLTGLYVGA